MKCINAINTIVAILAISLSVGCAYKYTGEGDYTELTRTYISGIAETKGFMLALPNFETKQDVSQSYRIGRLPKQDDQVYIDLITIAYSKLPSLDEQESDLNTIPKAHRIRFRLINARTKRELASGDSLVSALKATPNRKLMRPFILNLAEITPNSIPEETELEMEFEYLINREPLSREMFVIITKRARTL
jgi:hypothetical protein